MLSFGRDVGDQFDSFTDHIKRRGFEPIGGGSFRDAYQRGRVVIKVPYTTDGIHDNRVEARAWKRYWSNPTSRQIYLAPCRLLPNLCLMMVAVDTAVNWNTIPHWVDRIDSGQAGYYKGRLVAYDYACDVVERRQWEEEWYGELKSEWYSKNLRAEVRADRND